MLNLKKLLSERYLLILSLFSFIYLWDIKYNIYFEARYLIVLYLIYLLFTKNLFIKKFFIYAFIIFALLFLHQYLNIIYENNNIGFQILTNFNNILIDKYNNEVKKIYDLNNSYNLRLFSAICGLIICYFVSIFLIKHNIDFYNILFISFIIIFFIFDVFINIFSINKISPITYGSLCVSHFTIEKKFFNIFNENSHYGMIIPPTIIFIIYRLSKNFNYFNTFLLLILFITIFFNLSATIILGSILTILVLNIIELKRLNNKFRFFSIIVILYFLLMNILNSSCADRVLAAAKIINSDNTSFSNIINNTADNTVTSNYDSEIIDKKNLILNDLVLKKYFYIKTNKHLFIEAASNLKNNIFYEFVLNKYIDIGATNLTIEVLVNSLNISINSIIDKPLGWGLNRYHSAYIYYQPRLPVYYSEVRSLNFNDGVSNFSKIIVEFGLIAFVLFFFYIFFTFSYKIRLEDKIFLLPFIITQMIRGAGYFNGGFILITILIILKVINFNTKK